MSLRAGRVGVAKSQVDRNGNLIVDIPDPPEPEKELPEYSSTEAGKVLTVGVDGELEWAEKQGGGGIENFEVSKTIEGKRFSQSGAQLDGDDDIYVVDLLSVDNEYVVLFQVTLSGAATPGIRFGFSDTPDGAASDFGDYSWSSATSGSFVGCIKRKALKRYIQVGTRDAHTTFDYLAVAPPYENYKEEISDV